MKTLNGVVMDCALHPKGGWSATVHFECKVPIGTYLAAPQQAAPAVPIERVNFTDQSTASPIEKARRYLQAMADHRINSVYQFDDGYPKQATADDAAATLAVFDQLATHTQQEAPQQEVQEASALIHWPINGPPRLVWYSNKALHDAIRKSHEGHQPDVKLYTAQPAPSGDAARYRWLRAEHERIDPLCHVVWKVGGDRDGSDWANTALLDASIDAARKELIDSMTRKATDND